MFNFSSLLDIIGGDNDDECSGEIYHQAPHIELNDSRIVRNGP